MMKVHSILLARAVEDTDTGSNVQPLVRRRIKEQARQLIVIDGPFTESKESCPHVAILARRMKGMHSRIEAATAQRVNRETSLRLDTA
jgi:hypothetical protein